MTESRYHGCFTFGSERDHVMPLVPLLNYSGRVSYESIEPPFRNEVLKSSPSTLDVSPANHGAFEQHGYPIFPSLGALP